MPKQLSTIDGLPLIQNPHRCPMCGGYVRRKRMLSIIEAYDDDGWGWVRIMEQVESAPVYHCESCDWTEQHNHSKHGSVE
jgi:hypothetical protein